MIYFGWQNHQQAHITCSRSHRYILRGTDNWFKIKYLTEKNEAGKFSLSFWDSSLTLFKFPDFPWTVWKRPFSPWLSLTVTTLKYGLVIYELTVTSTNTIKANQIPARQVYIEYGWV